MDRLLEETFPGFPAGDTFWGRQAVEKFIVQNAEAIQKMVNSEDKRKELFEQNRLN